jgi:ubiquinone/menaquinone biosynthesis C-methylase UbiE
MTQLHQGRKQRPNPKTVFRRIVESNAYRKLDESEYRDHVRDLYDGPKGAVLSLASLISLHEPLVGRMLRRRTFDVTPFRSILDIGSGAGQILGHLVKAANPDARIVASDLSHQMLRRARSRVKSDRPEFVAANMTELPFADESFDCITCGWVLEHLSDPRPALAEFRRVLSPGGRVLLLVTENTYAGAITSRTWQCRTYSRDELQTACRETGLPWNTEIYFSRLHRMLKIGGILVEAHKPKELVEAR